MVDSNTYQAQRQQIMLLGATVFGSVVAAIVASTFIVMQLVSGQIASALSSNVTAPAATTSVVGTCVDVSATPAVDEANAPAAGTVMGSGVKLVGMGGVSNSFNSNSVVNNTSTVTTNNKEINKTKVMTFINDSFNRDSFNDVDVDVDVDSHDKTLNVIGNTLTVDSNNQANTTTTSSNNTAIETNLNSNNVVLTENHLLSDNTVVVTP